MTVQNIGAYLFNVVAARLLVPSAFGALTALLGVVLVVNVASLAIQTTTARRVAVDPDRAHRTAATGLGLALVTGLALGAVIVVVSPVLERLLQLDSVWPVVLAGACVLPLTLMGALAGTAQGLHRWNDLGAVYVGAGLGRLVLATAILVVWPTETGAMVGVFVGAWLPVLAGIRVAHRPVLRAAAPYARELAVGSHALLAYLVLSNLDALLARVVLTPHESGLYGAGLILTKAALFLPQFVSIVVFPRLAREGAGRARRTALLAVVGLGAAATAATAVLPWLALVLVGGEQYREVEHLLWLFALEGAVLALVNLLVFDALARRAHGIVPALWIASAVAAAVILLAPIHIATMTLTMTAVSVAVAATAWVAATRRPQIPQEGADQ